MYGQTHAYGRKGEMQATMQPYIPYPYTPMMYGNQGWMYAQGANGEMDQQGYEDPQMLGDVPSPQFYRHSRLPAPDEQHPQSAMNAVEERHLAESMARMQVLPQATTW